MFKHALLRRLEGVGIQLYPYYLIKEEINEHTPTDWAAQDAIYETGFATEADVDQLCALEQRRSGEKLQRLLRENKLCFVARKDQHIVGMTWCDLEEFNNDLIKFPLSAKQSYLFRAFVAHSERGAGLAPFLRYRCYQALNTLGRDEFFSYSDYYNTPAIRFKEKLGGRAVLTGLRLKLFDRYDWNWVLKHYGETGVALKTRIRR